MLPLPSIQCLISQFNKWRYQNAFNYFRVPQHVGRLCTNVARRALAARARRPALRSAARIQHAYKIFDTQHRWNRNPIFDSQVYLSRNATIFSSVRHLRQFTEAARLIVFRLSHQNNQNDAISVCDANLTDVAGDFVSSCLPAGFFDWSFVIYFNSLMYQKHELGTSVLTVGATNRFTIGERLVLRLDSQLRGAPNVRTTTCYQS